MLECWEEDEPGKGHTGGSGPDVGMGRTLTSASAQVSVSSRCSASEASRLSLLQSFSSAYHGRAALDTQQMHKYDLCSSKTFYITTGRSGGPVVKTQCSQCRGHWFDP